MEFTEQQKAHIASLVSLYTKRQHDIVLRHLNDKNINISKLDLSSLVPDESTIVERLFVQSIENPVKKDGGKKGKAGLKIKGAKPGLKIKGGKPGLKIKEAKPGLKIKEAKPGLKIKGGKPGLKIKESKPTLKVVEAESQPTLGVVEAESKPTPKVVEAESKPTLKVVEAESKPTLKVVEVESTSGSKKKSSGLKLKKSAELNKANLEKHDQGDSNYQEFYDLAKSLDYDVFEHTETNWKGPAFTIPKSSNIEDVKSKFKMDLTIISGKTDNIIHPKLLFNPDSVIYDVDPEVESEKSIIDSDSEDDSEVEIECIRWNFKGTEYILDETTNNIYLDNKFIGKREPGTYQGEYYIDYDGKE